MAEILTIRRKTLYNQSICIPDHFQHCKNTEIVLLSHFKLDQSHKCWRTDPFNKILAHSET